MSYVAPTITIALSCPSLTYTQVGSYGFATSRNSACSYNGETYYSPYTIDGVTPAEGVTLYINSSGGAWASLYSHIQFGNGNWNSISSGGLIGAVVDTGCPII